MIKKKLDWAQRLGQPMGTINHGSVLYQNPIENSTNGVFLGLRDHNKPKAMEAPHQYG